jgi:hypothetical protein
LPRATLAQRWPYDADRNDPLTCRRIPVTSSQPRIRYLLAFDRASPCRPDEAEELILACYVDYLAETRYQPGWHALARRQTFDVDTGQYPTLVHKYGPGEWGYRKSNWPSPDFTPTPQVDTDYAPVTLVGVLDRAEVTWGDQPAPKWLAWKADHVSIFSREDG